MKLRALLCKLWHMHRENITITSDYNQGFGIFFEVLLMYHIHIKSIAG